ncbi:MAG: Gfo/Idh/MocA family oxidoreductase [Anaerolineae bacterium]|nr:Gfo/Idh/MocA family oxidoreductase [Anaerolineae bacterium]
MAQVLRWGLLSTARINRRLIPAMRQARRTELVAVASRSQAAAGAYAAEWRIPRALGSYQALLDDPGIDAVYISLPNSLHAEWAVRAARAGKHVLCEKPLALSVADCDRIQAAADAAGVVVAEAIMYLYHPLLHEARRLARDGALGEVGFARGSFSFILDRPDNVRWKPELGGGALWDIGIYPVSFCRWILGEPDRVFAWQTLADSGVDAAAAGLLHFPGGQTAAFDCSFRQAFRTQVEVAGGEATLTIDRPFLIRPDSRMVLRDKQDREREIGDVRPDPYQCEVEAIAAAVLDGAPLPVPLSSSRSNVAALVALYESARLGAPVSL